MEDAEQQGSKSLQLKMLQDFNYLDVTIAIFKHFHLSNEGMIWKTYANLNEKKIPYKISLIALKKNDLNYYLKQS